MEQKFLALFLLLVFTFSFSLFLIPFVHGQTCSDWNQLCSNDGNCCNGMICCEHSKLAKYRTCHYACCFSKADCEDGYQCVNGRCVRYIFGGGACKSEYELCSSNNECCSGLKCIADASGTKYCVDPSKFKCKGNSLYYDNEVFASSCAYCCEGSQNCGDLSACCKSQPCGGVCSKDNDCPTCGSGECQGHYKCDLVRGSCTSICNSDGKSCGDNGKCRNGECVKQPTKCTLEDFKLGSSPKTYDVTKKLKEDCKCSSCTADKYTLTVEPDAIGMEYAGSTQPPERTCEEIISSWSRGEELQRKKCDEDGWYWVKYKAKLEPPLPSPQPQPQPGQCSVSNVKITVEGPFCLKNDMPVKCDSLPVCNKDPVYFLINVSGNEGNCNSLSTIVHFYDPNKNQEIAKGQRNCKIYQDENKFYCPEKDKAFLSGGLVPEFPGDKVKFQAEVNNVKSNEVEKTIDCQKQGPQPQPQPTECQISDVQLSVLEQDPQQPNCGDFVRFKTSVTGKQEKCESLSADIRMNEQFTPIKCEISGDKFTCSGWAYYKLSSSPSVQTIKLKAIVSNKAESNEISKEVQCNQPQPQPQPPPQPQPQPQPTGCTFTSATAKPSAIDCSKEGPYEVEITLSNAKDCEGKTLEIKKDSFTKSCTISDNKCSIELSEDDLKDFDGAISFDVYVDGSKTNKKISLTFKNCKKLPPGMYMLRLYRGWNMVSIPYKSYSVASDCPYIRLPFYSWNASADKWDEVNDITKLAGRGFWVYTSRSCSIIFSVKDPLSANDISLQINSSRQSTPNQIAIPLGGINIVSSKGDCELTKFYYYNITENAWYAYNFTSQNYSKLDPNTNQWKVIATIPDPYIPEGVSVYLYTKNACTLHFAPPGPPAGLRIIKTV